MGKRNFIKLILVSLVVAAAILFRILDLGEMLTLQHLKEQQDALRNAYEAEPSRMLAGYFAVFVLVTAVSVPGATVLALAGGAIFGFLPAVAVVSLSSTIGATCAFLLSRFVLHDWVQSRFGARLRRVNEEMRNDGVVYLLSLRLLPVIPFFVVNLIMGLTPMKTVPFFFVSLFGMLPAIMVFVNAGTQLGRIDSARDIVSPGMLISLVLVASVPPLSRRAVRWLRDGKRSPGAENPDSG